LATALEIWHAAIKRGAIHGASFSMRPGHRPEKDGTFTSLIRVACSELVCTMKPEHGFDMENPGFLEAEEATKDAIKRLRSLEQEIASQGAERVQHVEN
jgi:hypothetical protein